MDTRHLRRQELVQQLYAYSYKTSQAEPSSDFPTMQKIVSYLSEIDVIIQKSAPKYTIDKIAKTDLAILRLAVYELNFEKIEPQKVVINEAVELAKEFGGEHSYKFVNAVLAKVTSLSLVK